MAHVCRRGGPPVGHATEEAPRRCTVVGNAEMVGHATFADSHFVMAYKRLELFAPNLQRCVYTCFEQLWMVKNLPGHDRSRGYEVTDVEMSGWI